MTVDPETRPASARLAARGRLGLRLRLWLGCLAGTLVAGAGAFWVLASLVDPSEASSGVSPLVSRLAVVMVVAVTVSVALAAWLDQGIVGGLRTLSRRIDEGMILDSGTRAGWGELDTVSRSIDALVVRRRQLGRSLEELERLQRELALATAAVERWATSEGWEAPAIEEAPVRTLVAALDRGLGRQREVGAQNREAARQVRADLLACLENARDAAAGAEHGFVEATASLTSVNEIQRLAGELQQGLAGRDSAARPDEAWRSAATAAIEELAAAASESVEHLASGFLRVQEIGEQVHQLSNRATLIALHTLLTGARPEESPEAGDGLHAELKQLAIEVRSATSRVAELSRELEREIQGATERMRGIRERVALRLEQIPEVAESAMSEDVRRLLERLREMAQDASRKSERVTRSIERASRSAQDIVRRLEDESADLEGLLVRLSPSSAESAGEGEPGAGARPTGLKVIERRPEAGGSQQTRGGGEIA